jgi:hypothetical protein
MRMKPGRQNVGRWLAIVCVLHVATLAVDWQTNRACGNETVVNWDFSRRDDLNFDNQPDGWKRTFGNRHPRYLRLEIVPHAPAQEVAMRRIDAEVLKSWLDGREMLRKLPPESIVVSATPSLPRICRTLLRLLPQLPPSLADASIDRYLRGEVDGGGIMSTGPSFEVKPDYSYYLSGRITTQGLVHNRAWVEMIFFDASGEIVQSLSTPQFEGTSQWSPLEIGPIAAPISATTGRVRVRYEPQQRGDLSGWVGFDDLQVARMPRIRVETDAPMGLYAESSQPIVRCLVSGVEGSVQAIEFALLDDVGRILETKTVPLNAMELPPAKFAQPTGPVATGAAATWQIPALGPGFYRVQANLADRPASGFTFEQTFAILGKMPSGPGPFGWSLIDKERQSVPIRALPDWLEQCHVQWLKYDCWILPEDYNAADELAWLAGRMQDRNIQMVGVLNEPPLEICSDLSAMPHDPAAILFRDSELWQPLLEPVMTRLSSGIRWWQLGDDRDHSFLGRTQLKQSIDEIRIGLQGFGQPIQLVLNWPWLERLPPPDEWSWQAVMLSDRTPMTSDEINSYFEAADGVAVGNTAGTAGSDPTAKRIADNPSDSDKDGSNYRVASLTRDSPLGKSTDPVSAMGVSETRPWIVLQPLDRNAYPREDRIRDLILRMVAVRNQRIHAAFVAEPFDPSLAMLRPDGSPDEMLLPWRTAASLLASMRPVGSLELPGGSQNVLLANETSATLVVWNDTGADEQLYLGQNARHIDAFGREMKIEPVTARGFQLHQFHVSGEPSFVVDMDRTAALWRLGVKLDRQRIDSLLGRQQEINVTFQNPSFQNISGLMRIEAPDSWNVADSMRPIAMESMRYRSEPVSIILRGDATIGSEKIAIDFELEGDQQRRFTVWRSIEVGPEDINMEVSTRLLADGRLLVRQEITNLSSVVKQFDCYVFAPGRRRQRQVALVEIGQTTVREFIWGDGRELIGRDLLLRAEQQGGDRTLNYRFSATP